MNRPGRIVAGVKLSMMINYSGDFHADVRKVQELEAAGLDLVWVPEAYSFDAVSQMGYLAASTTTNCSAMEMVMS